MKVKSIIAVRVVDSNGNTFDITPGERNYKFSHKDPLIAEQLRVFRKHGRMTFEELLPCDVEVMKKTEGSPADKVDAAKAAATLKPSPAGRKVKGEKSDVRKSPRTAKKAESKTNTNKSDGAVSE